MDKMGFLKDVYQRIKEGRGLIPSIRLAFEKRKILKIPQTRKKQLTKDKVNKQFNEFDGIKPPKIKKSKIEFAKTDMVQLREIDASSEEYTAPPITAEQIINGELELLEEANKDNELLSKTEIALEDLVSLDKLAPYLYEGSDEDKKEIIKEIKERIRGIESSLDGAELSSQEAVDAIKNKLNEVEEEVYEAQQELERDENEYYSSLERETKGIEVVVDSMIPRDTKQSEVGSVSAEATTTFKKPTRTKPLTNKQKEMAMNDRSGQSLWDQATQEQKQTATTTTIANLRLESSEPPKSPQSTSGGYPPKNKIPSIS